MTDDQRATMGETLAAMRGRSGRTLAQVATDGGWRGVSSAQRYFEHDYDPPAINPHLGKRLIAALCGHGSHPVHPNEIEALCDRMEIARAPGRMPTRAAGTHVKRIRRHSPREHMIDLSTLELDARLAMLTLYRSLTTRNGGSRHDVTSPS